MLKSFVFTGRSALRARGPFCSVFSFVFLALMFVAVMAAAPLWAARAAETLRLATTTSTQNSGLLDELLPVFEKESGIRVHVIAVGTGKALRMGASGDVDGVMVHAPGAEMKYVREGAFVMRRPLMHNYFVLLGPPEDPAHASGAANVAEALRRIAQGRLPFVSRGDGSGTHIKETALWREAAIEPKGKWYMEVGQGMGQALVIANQKQAYTISDDGTFFAFKSRLGLAIHSKKEPSLRNSYSVMAVNPEKHPHVQFALFKRFIEWLTAPAAQGRIGAYQRNGRLLFTPVTK